MLAARGHGLGDALGGDGDHREVDRGVDVAEPAVGPYAVQQVGGDGLVHGVQVALEAAVAQVPQHRRADSPAGAADSDHRHRAGGQQPLHGAGLGTLFAGALHGQGLGGGFEVEGEVDGAALEAALLLVADVGEDLDHLAVGGQHLGREPADAPLAGDRADVLEEGGGDSAALVGVLDEEGHLGLVGGGGGGPAVGADPVVADGADELLADGRREADPVHVVVVREAVHVAVGQPGVGREEAVVLRLVGDLLVEADQPARVLRGDRPDPGGAAVTQDDVRFPVGRVRGVRRGGHAAILRPRPAGQLLRGARGK